MLHVALSASLVLGAALLVAPEAAAQNGARECRDVTQAENGRPRIVKLCRDNDGQWRALAGKSGTLAPNFRGKIVYQGSYETEQERRARARSPVRLPTRLSLGSVLNAVNGNARNAREGESDETKQGTATYTIEYDSNLVTGSWRMNDGSREISGRFSGTREGGHCQLFDERQSSFVATCDAGIFRGESNSAASARVTWSTRFDATATETVDYVERDRLASAARVEAIAKAEVARAAELTERRKLRARLPKSAVARYTPLLNNAVVADSAHWFSNRYATGSIDLVGVQADPQSGSVFLKAYFQYANGGEGWLGAIVKGQRIQCLQFWDDPSGCRGIGDGANAKLAQGFLQSMMAPSPSPQGGMSEADKADAFYSSKAYQDSMNRQMGRPVEP